MRGDFPGIVEYGYCKCGCGEKTTLAPQSFTKRGWIKGEPIDFVSGHNNRLGKNSPKWKGGRHILKCRNTEYVQIHMPKHHRSDARGYVLEHILAAEKAMGDPLPDGAIVHHIDGDGLNNKSSNLMMFLSNSQHLKFHARHRR